MLIQVVLSYHIVFQSTASLKGKHYVYKCVLKCWPKFWWYLWKRCLSPAAKNKVKYTFIKQSRNFRYLPKINEYTYHLHLLTSSHSWLYSWWVNLIMGFPGGSVGKESARNAGWRWERKKKDWGRRFSQPMTGWRTLSISNSCLLKQQRGFHATHALQSPPSKTSKGSQINSDHHAPSALGWWGCRLGPGEGAQSLLLASCSFPGTRRPEPQRRTDGVLRFLPPALSSPLSLLIHLFGWIGSRMEPRWIIMSFLITPCICIPCYSLHGASWLKWIIYIINIWL